MATAPERITALEQDKKYHWIVLTAAVLAAAGWLTYLTVTLNGAVGDLRAVKQSIHDGGLGSIVSQIQNPSSPQQLNAILNFATSQLEVQQVNKVKPDPRKLDTLSAAVRNATLKNPENPVVWQAGARLVNYRYQSQQEVIPSSNLPSCLARGDYALEQLMVTPHTPEYSGEGGFALTSENCLLDLDADANTSFAGSGAQKFFDAVNRRNPGNGNVIALTGALVTYSGGPTIPIDKIICINCVFKIEASDTVPSKAGQFLTDQLLIADTSKTSVTLPNGM